MVDQPWPVSIAENHYQFSYRITESGGESAHTSVTLAEAIRVAGEAVKSVVWTGWSMFHQFGPPELAPIIVIDMATGEETEALETDLMGRTYIENTVPDFWRITVDGRATIIRPYREDRFEIPPHIASAGLSPGQWLSPRTLVREVYELVTHAKELAKFFEYADTIEFRCTWIGLTGRQVQDFTSGANWRKRVCNTNSRTSALAVSVEQISASTESVVAELTGPVLRLFGGLNLGAEWIAVEAPKFRFL